ncbi:MAG: helix-turn-helix transcriptional regulator [Lysobacter sp.]|nr:helix-turn-helix transcriptional regulator [Lysobacter sp.]
MAISNEERAFFIAFGERLSALRKGQGLTQVQLAQLLDVSQQAITAYESGQRRVPISTLPLLARTLGVSLEDLIGVPASRGTGKRGPAPKLQQQLEQLSRLPKTQQRLVSQLIDTVLQQHRG